MGVGAAVVGGASVVWAGCEVTGVEVGVDAGSLPLSLSRNQSNSAMAATATAATTQTRVDGPARSGSFGGIVGTTGGGGTASSRCVVAAPAAGSTVVAAPPSDSRVASAAATVAAPAGRSSAFLASRPCTEVGQPVGGVRAKRPHVGHRVVGVHHHRWPPGWRP